MGIFSRLFGSSRPKSKSTSRGHQLTPWPGFAFVREEKLKQGFSRKLYVYDARPYDEVPTGQEIEVEFFLGDAILRSQFTDAEVDTTKQDAVCLLYKGSPVGVIFINNRDLKLAHGKGIVLKATATVGGPLNGHPDLRELTLHLPSGSNAIRELLLASNVYADGVPPSAQKITYNEWDEADFQSLLSKNKWTFKDVSLEFLPVPKGSQAKPHVAVTAADGMLISKVTARNSYYSNLVDTMEHASAFYVTAKKRTGFEDRVRYTITIWYW